MRSMHQAMRRAGLPCALCPDPILLGHERDRRGSMAVHRECGERYDERTETYERHLRRETT